MASCWERLTLHLRVAAKLDSHMHTHPFDACTSWDKQYGGSH